MVLVKGHDFLVTRPSGSSEHVVATRAVPLLDVRASGHHSDFYVRRKAQFGRANWLARRLAKQMSIVARSLDLSIDQLRTVMYELPYPNGESRSVEPCPLSTREVEVLRRLRDGKVYKQIALELSLSTSTVRTHLHNTYAKLGAVDRAQAVLIATQRGWI